MWSDDVNSDSQLVCVRKRKKKTNCSKSIDLFCGAGGLDLGFEKAGFRTLWANDFDADACKTHQSWSKARVVCGDISKIDYSTIPDSDVILGGFPCQDFSIAGKRLGFNSHKSHLGVALEADEPSEESRGQLYMWMREVITLTAPKLFIAENVK